MLKYSHNLLVKTILIKVKYCHPLRLAHGEISTFRSLFEIKLKRKDFSFGCWALPRSYFTVFYSYVYRRKTVKFEFYWDGIIPGDGVKTGVINSWDKGNGEKYTDVCMGDCRHMGSLPLCCFTNMWDRRHVF